MSLTPANIVDPPVRRKPVILVTPDVDVCGAGDAERLYSIRANYVEALGQAGGVAVIVPQEQAHLDEVVAIADGILISGTGPGVTVGSQRQAFEGSLVNAALAAGIPVLGICHGMQVIGECLGGYVVRDLPEMNADVTPHIPYGIPDRLAHEIRLESGSLLAGLNGGTSAAVNSLHRHVIAEHGRFRIAARAPDGVIEAIEGFGDGFCLGVQWHPEYLLTELDARMLAAFVQHCAAFAARRNGHSLEPSVRTTLAELGLALPKPSAPPGAFVGAIRSGNMLTVSGQVPLKEGQVLRTGRLGQDVSLEDGQECARWALLNALAHLDQAAGGLDRIGGFVRLAGYVAATPDFTQHGAVVDGASRLLRDLFPQSWAHSRIAVGVASLPRGVPVEIELSAVLSEGY